MYDLSLRAHGARYTSAGAQLSFRLIACAELSNARYFSTVVALRWRAAFANAAPSRGRASLKVGPRKNNYIYNLVEASAKGAPDDWLWECDIPAEGWEVEDGWTLFICKDKTWMAMRARAETATAAEVRAHKVMIFGSTDADVTEDGSHNWDAWDGENWTSLKNFDTASPT
jgi:hypothetical protein